MAKKQMKWLLVLALVLTGVVAGSSLAQNQNDFGLRVQNMLESQSDQLFGVGQPLADSAIGPYTGLDNTQAVIAAAGLTVTNVSSAANALSDQIALWPSDSNPTHLIVAVEGGTTGPAVQVIDLNGNPNSNAVTILQGLTSADPIRRTPWGTIIVAEEATDGGFYEIFDPLSITTPVLVTDRAAGTTSDPAHVIKRKAVGKLAWEGIVIKGNGTMYFADELRPGNGAPGGAVYKFVPDVSYLGGSITPGTSPFVSGKLYGLRVGHSDYGQGTEIGKGSWVLIDPITYQDTAGNVTLRNAQAALKLTGYYRPEDMDQDLDVEAQGITRMCWTNTGNMSNGGGSIVETIATYGEVVCMVDEAQSDGTTIPFVTRYFAGGPEANYFDNLDFQPGTGALVVLEDGEVVVQTVNGQVLKGNDVWMLLPDGDDRDVQSDGAIRILSLRDTSSEPTGWIFDATGKTAYVNLQHRSTNLGAVLKITGFKIPRR